MKIAMLCPIISATHPSGLMTNVLEISRRLSEEGHQITIYTTSKNPRNYMIGKIKVREFPAFSPNHTYFFSPKLFFALKKGNEDIIHCHGYNSLLALSALLAKKSHQKLVITLHSSGPSSDLRKFLGKWYDWTFNLFSRRIDKIICVSEFEKSFFEKKIPPNARKFVVIPNGVDIDVIRNVKAKKKNQIVSLGRLVRNKGFHHLIRSFSLLLDDLPDIKLKIIGKGSYEDELKSLVKELGISKSVEFQDSIELHQREKLIRALKESRLFVFLSNYESQGIVVAEAIACGLPAIVAYNSGMKDFVDKKCSIGIRDVTDYPSIAKAMKSSLVSPKNQKFRHISGSVIISWDEVASRIVDMYKRL